MFDVAAVGTAPDRTRSRAVRQSQQASVRVLVLDGQPLYRDALARVMEGERAIELTHATGHLAEACDGIARYRPHVVIVDRDLVRDELERLARTATDAGTRLLLLAGEIDARDVYGALARGVAGYVSKDATAAAVCEAVLAIAGGETRLDVASQTVVASEIRLRARDDRPQLSPREQQILTLIAAGRTAPQVAAELHISTATVKTHLLHLYEKLGVAERAAAVAEGMRLGLLE